MTLTQYLDLRGGQPCWQAADDTPLSGDPIPNHAIDTVIVGAGVMGAMLAETLSSVGRTVAVLDRRPPVQGATAASTALVMWASDVPLSELARSIGADAAAARWRRVHQAVLQLDLRIKRLDLACGWRPRPEVYLAGDVLDRSGLQVEAQARDAAGLPSTFLTPEAVAAEFGITPRAALISTDAFEVDPVALSLGLLAKAREAGATVSHPVEVLALTPRPDSIQVELAGGGVITAGQVIIATGYEQAREHLPDAFTLGSSFAFATARGIAPKWERQAMIWEAADPYLYARPTTDGRIIVGGGDEDFADAKRRDAMIPAKADALRRQAEKVLDCGPLEIDCAWAATFGSSPDGLPAIGRTRADPRIWLAQGFGGNGVTFASLAAGLLGDALSGQPDPDAPGFDPYRFG